MPYYQRHRTGEGIVFVIAGAASFCPELEALVQDPERALLLPAGIAVLTAAAGRLGSELLPARGGLREGAVLELAAI